MKAFDSVSKDMIRHAWERVDVSISIVDWLIALDADKTYDCAHRMGCG